MAKRKSMVRQEVVIRNVTLSLGMRFPLDENLKDLNLKRTLLLSVLVTKI